MSLSAKLQLGDNSLQMYNSEYAVVECGYQMAKSYDKTARMIDSQTNMAKIVLSVIAPTGSDFTLYNWYAEMMLLNGRVVIDLSSIYAAYNENSCKTICFEEAYCVGIAEKYNIDALSRRELTLTLLAKNLQVDRVDLSVRA